jgi:hypothetical protein
MFRKFRILVLLLILLFVAVRTWQSNERVTSWEYPVIVALYPIAADDLPETADFIRALNDDSFKEIENWVEKEAARHGVIRRKPVGIWLEPQVMEKPPELSRAPNTLEAIMWSLKLRWWAYWHDKTKENVKPHVRLFVYFHGQDDTVPHSVGLTKGKIGVIHVFASRQQQDQNAVIIAHELLHTFGATDKYNLATQQPLYPIGYAEPERQPLLPQSQAEIMGGRIPVSQEEAKIPDNLAKTRIGAATALEIGLVSVDK